MSTATEKGAGHLQRSELEEMQMTIDFVRDDSKDSVERSEQVVEILCQLILLAKKKGRPKMDVEEVLDAA